MDDVRGFLSRLKSPARSRSVRIGVVATAVALAGVIAYVLVLYAHRLPEGLIQANGRIEGDVISIAAKLPGRIAELKVREGDSVQPGQVLVVLDSEQINARIAQARAASAALEAQLTAARTSLDALRKQVPLQITSADSGVAQAEAMLKKARAAASQAVRDEERLQALAQRGSVAKQRGELAELAAVAAQADVAAAEQTLARARQSAVEARLGNDRLRAKTDEVAALAAQLMQTRAALDEAQSFGTDLTLKAPSGGVVVTRVRNAGEVIAAGSPILEIVDLDRLYLRVYVPEADIGKVRLNLPAQIYVDSIPDQAFPARVRFISSRAEFTPKEVQTTDERVKLTYAVHLYLDANPDHRLSPGVPADAMIRWKSTVSWRRPRW